jgi:hypothetical protein
MLNIFSVAFDNLTTAQRNAIASPAKGLVIFNVTENKLQINEGTSGAPVWADASGESLIIQSATAPTDISRIWQKSADNELYFYDGSNWVSIDERSILASEPGPTPNNSFLKFGDVRSNPSRGWTVPYDLKITRGTWTNVTAFIVTFLLFESGAPVGQVATTAGARGQSPSTPVGVQLSQNNYLSIQYSGVTNNNVYFELFYRKIGA